MIELRQLDLPAPVAPGDEQVRHRGQVHHHGLAVDVAAHRHLERVGGPLGLGRGEDVAEGDDLAVGVGHLDADRLTTGDRRQDADVGRRHRVGDVLVEAGDPGDLHAGPELELVAGDRRADHHADELRLDAVLGERLLEDVARRLDRRLVDLLAAPAGAGALGGGSFHGEPFTAGPSSISSCSVSTGSSGSGSCTFGLRGPGGRLRWAASGSPSASRSMQVVGVLVEHGRRRAPGRRPPPSEKRLAPTRLAASTSARPAGRVAAAVLSAAARTGTRVSTTRPASTSARGSGRRPRARCPRPAARRRRRRAGRRRRPARRWARRAPGGRRARWRRPHPPIAIISPPTQRYELRGRVDLVVVGVRRAAHQHDARAPTSATGTMRRPQPTTMPMLVSRPRPTGPAASA